MDGAGHKKELRKQELISSQAGICTTKKTNKKLLRMQLVSDRAGICTALSIKNELRR